MRLIDPRWLVNASLVCRSTRRSIARRCDLAGGKSPDGARLQGYEERYVSTRGAIREAIELLTSDFFCAGTGRFDPTALNHAAVVRAAKVLLSVDGDVPDGSVLRKDPDGKGLLAGLAGQLGIDHLLAWCQRHRLEYVLERLRLSARLLLIL